MNRLIIIGNGFDLAHGLKTSYCDFLENYFQRAINNFNKSGEYEDILLSLRQSLRGTGAITQSFDESSIKTFEKVRKDSRFVFSIKSSLLQNSIYKAQTINWVDLENEYFELLKSYTSQAVNGEYYKVVKLNTELQFLKNRLEIYLQSVEFDLDKFNPSPEIKTIFATAIKDKEVLLRTNDLKHRSNLFLNFNYTNTVENI